MSYARQKTWEAVSSLTTSRPLQERLAFAGQPLIVLRMWAKEEGQSAFGSKLEKVLDMLTCGHTQDIQRGAASLSDEEARQAADDILSLMVDAFGGL